ncbi:MAG: helix-turn-helix transcriptional regulator [Acidimicrobiales bacterium]
MPAAAILRSARTARGLSQRDLAAATGIAQPTIAIIETTGRDTTIDHLDELLRALGHSVASLPTILPSVGDWAATLRRDRVLDPGAIRTVLVQMADDLATVDPATRVALCAASPGRTGDRTVDALLAGLVEHLLREDDLPVPLWVDDADRIAETEWDFVTNAALVGLARANTPEPFRRRNVFVPAEALESV